MMITVEFVDGPMVGAHREVDTIEVNLVFAEYEVWPKVSIRPGEKLRTQGPVTHEYGFSSWAVEPAVANYALVL